MFRVSLPKRRKVCRTWLTEVRYHSDQIIYHNIQYNLNSVGEFETLIKIEEVQYNTPFQPALWLELKINWNYVSVLTIQGNGPYYGWANTHSLFHTITKFKNYNTYSLPAIDDCPIGEVTLPNSLPLLL